MIYKTGCHTQQQRFQDRALQPDSDDIDRNAEKNRLGQHIQSNYGVVQLTQRSRKDQIEDQGRQHPIKHKSVDRLGITEFKNLSFSQYDAQKHDGENGENRIKKGLNNEVHGIGSPPSVYRGVACYGYAL